MASEQGSDDVTNEPRPSGPWEIVNPPGFPHVGYANAIVSGEGRRVSLAGQTDMGADGKIRNPGDLVAQTEGSFAAIAQVLSACGGEPEHLVRMRIYVLDADAYAEHGKAIGKAYRQHFGRWFPAMTLVQVARLFDPQALIEIESDAVIP